MYYVLPCVGKIFLSFCYLQLRDGLKMFCDKLIIGYIGNLRLLLFHVNYHASIIDIIWTNLIVLLVNITV